MLRSLVGSEMCIRDRARRAQGASLEQDYEPVSVTPVSCKSRHEVETILRENAIKSKEDRDFVTELRRQEEEAAALKCMTGDLGRAVEQELDQSSNKDGMTPRTKSLMSGEVSAEAFLGLNASAPAPAAGSSMTPRTRSLISGGISASDFLGVSAPAPAPAPAPRSPRSPKKINSPTHRSHRDMDGLETVNYLMGHGAVQGSPTSSARTRLPKAMPSEEL
eukprot:TRINITY_DN1473_c0_g1_i3.p1 TRINITY_DN1473_c0_g1~~TRINITY_DN1473_c0_g1_i3.p1  ORF type:complete len:220 (+),score=44.11 TRINITY_DN1473_c0_g1_i3:78-737(+)